MNKKRRHIDYAREQHHVIDDGFATIPELPIYSMLPGKIFDKGPSLAIALGICVGLSFGAGILSGWYSYRTTDSSVTPLWPKGHLNKVASDTINHKARVAPASLTFFDELQQPSQEEQMKLETEAPPKHLIAALDPVAPVNNGASLVEILPKDQIHFLDADKINEVANVPLGDTAKDAVLGDTTNGRGDQMALALSRLLGEPTADVFPDPPPTGIPVSPQPTKKLNWNIQVSAFSDKIKASSLVSHLRDKGYVARLSQKTKEASGKVVYPVLISGFVDEEDALLAQESLSREEGLNSFLIRP